MTKRLFIHSFETEYGQIRLASTEKGLAIITLPNESEFSFEARVARFFPDHEIYHGGEHNRSAEKQLKAYFKGKLTQFSLKLDIIGTPFQKKVLKKVADIPYGRTRSYGEIAAAVGNPRAFRAVGTANARNNLPLVIPCHRVVASNGLGGYGGGLNMKKMLLEREGALLPR